MALSTSVKPSTSPTTLADGFEDLEGSTSNSSSPSPPAQDAANATTSTPRSTTAPGCASCGPIRRSDQKTAIQFLDYVLSRLRFQGEKVQTDNGAEFQSSFHWHVLDQGIGHIYIRPATPRLTGKVQRSHRIDAEEFYRLLDGVVEDDTGLFNDKLREWEDYYNYHRPHGAAGRPDPVRTARGENQGWTVTEVVRPYSHQSPRMDLRNLARRTGRFPPLAHP